MSANVGARVTCLGPPAVGKSTLCRAVVAQSPSWLTVEEATRMAVANSDTGSRLRRTVRRLLHQRLDLCRIKERLLSQFLERHHQLVSSVVDRWFEPEMQLPPLAIRYRELLLWCRDWLFWHEYARGANVLADNCRMTRGVAECGDAEIVRCFCASSIAPTAVVHLEAEPELILHRIRERAERTNQMHPGHVGRDDAGLREYTARRLRVNAAAVAEFRRLGVPVLTVDAADSRSVDAVCAFLRGLQMPVI